MMLSVIVTVFNSEAFLDECLRSVCDSDYSDLQIVLVNDGSTDNSAEICDRWSARDPRIELHHRQHEGRNSALKFAHDQARGEAQCCVDADDIVLPRAFTRSVAKLSNDAQLIYTYRELIDAQGQIIGPHDKNKIAYRPTQILVDNMTFHLRTFSTELFNASGGVGPFQACEDWDMNLRMSELTKVRCIPQILYRYRIHKDQMSRTPLQNQEGKIAVENAIERRGLNMEIFVDSSGFHLRRRNPPPLLLP